MNNKKAVLVQDEFITDKPIDNLYWFVHTPAVINISPDKRSAVLSIGDKRLKAELLVPLNAQFSVLDASPLTASAQPEKQTPNQGVHRLTVHLTHTRSATISVVFKEANYK